MKLSRFNLWVDDYPGPGEHILFNARTQALMKITGAFRDSLQRCSARELAESLPALKANGILVDDEADEEHKLSDFFRQLKYDVAALSFEVTILTTYNCNFRCVYCFEESVREHRFLDKETSDRIVSWLSAHVQRKGIKKLFLVYYGGEPLLNVRPVYDISWQLREWAAGHDVSFGFGIITNGSLLTRPLVEKLLPVGLRLVRISLDGDRDAHDKRRPFADGRPSFDRIIRNIRDIIDLVPVGIAGNFDRTNYAGIYRLLDFLEKEQLLHKFERVDFAPLSPRLGPRNNPAAIELSSCLSHFGKDGVFGELIGIKQELMRRGVKIDTGLAINACSLTMAEGGITIDPHGLIYKCNALLGYPEFAVGSVSDDAFNEQYHDFLHADAWNHCPRECAYLPMCQGGCRFFSYLENNNFHDMCCKKDFFDAIVPDLIKLEYSKLTG